MCLHRPLIWPHIRQSGFPSRLILTPPAPSTGFARTLVGSVESLSCIGSEERGWMRLELLVGDEAAAVDATAIGLWWWGDGTRGLSARLV